VDDPAGVAPRLYFQRVPEEKVAKNRLHLDLDVGGGAAVSIEERKARIVAEVEAGKQADLIAVSGDPLAEPELWRDPARIVFVMQGGRVVADRRGA
jgi:hypothetical protein